MRKIVSIFLVMLMAVSIFGALSITAAAADPVSFTIPNVQVKYRDPESLFEYDGDFYLSLIPGEAMSSIGVLAGPALTSGAETMFGPNETKNIVASANFGTEPGVFHYVLKENAGEAVGMSWSKREYDVFVHYGYNADRTELKVLNVFCYLKKNDSGNDVTYTFGDVNKKTTPEFNNEFMVDYASVTKHVEGNMGNEQKDFTFTAKLVYDPLTLNYFNNGKYVWSYIIYQINGEQETVIASDEITDSNNDSMVFTLKHNQRIYFSDIPAGATLTITENSYASEGYSTVAEDDGGDLPFVSTTTPSGKVCAMKAEFPNDQEIGYGLQADVLYTNTKEETVTGVFMDYAPYLAVLTVAVMAGVAFIVMKRRKVEN